MNWLDAVLLIILGLSAFSGFWRGLMRSMAGLAALVFSFAAAYYYYHPVGEYLERSFGLGSWLTRYFSERLGGPPPHEPVTAVLMNVGDGANPLDLLLQFMFFQGGQNFLNQAFASVLASAALNAIAFLLVFTAVNLVIGAVANTVPGVPLLAPLDRAGGFFFGLLRGFLVGMALVAVLQLLDAAGGAAAPTPFSAGLAGSLLAPSYLAAFNYLLALMLPVQHRTI